MKRNWTALALALGLTLTLTACGGNQDEAETPGSAAPTGSQTPAAESDLDYVKGNGVLKIGYTLFEPMNYLGEDGELTGFETEFATAVCAKLGVEPKFVEINWDSKIMEHQAQTIDCIWNGFTMTGREDEYTFSEPYVDNSIVFVVMNDSDIQTEADLAGKVVVTQADSSALAALTNTEDNDENLALAASFAALEQVADYNTAFMELESGVVDAIAVDIGVAQYQLTSRGDTFRQLEEPLSTEQYAIAFKLGNTELRDQVQATLDEMLEDGTFDEIVANYSDYNLDKMVCLGK